MNFYLKKSSADQSSLRIVVMAIALTFPGLFFIGWGYSFGAWLSSESSLDPIVFIERNLTGKQLSALKKELKQIEEVGAIRHETSRDNRAFFVRKLKLDRSDVTLEPAMFPKSLRLELQLPYFRYPSVYSNIDQFEERSGVYSVSTPSQRRIRLYYWGQFGLAGGLVLLGVFIFPVSRFLQRSFERQLQDRDDRHRLLDRLGFLADQHRKHIRREGLKTGLFGGGLSSLILITGWLGSLSIYHGGLFIPGIHWGWAGVVFPTLCGTLIGQYSISKVEKSFFERGVKLEEINLRSLLVGARKTDV